MGDRWEALRGHRERVEGVGLRGLFADDPGRVARMGADVGELHVDWSRHLVDAEAWAALEDLAVASGVEAARDAMFAGEAVNVTEGRAALHVALRADDGDRYVVDGDDVVPRVVDVRRRMATFAEDVRSGRRVGATGVPIRTVVNIGIGGSDLGPAMACRALAPYAVGGPDVRFVSNVDPTDLADALAGLDPAETLFIVCSKSFRTVETMVNAEAARRWLADGLAPSADEATAVAAHVVAVSAAPEAAGAFGVAADGVFEMWDWVGGRYSLGSAVGLSSMVAVGPERFAELLAGMREVDEHFRTAPLSTNLPVVLGLLGVWYRDVWGAATHAVLPYSGRLARFPAYLQQLEMESNGKRVRVDGSAVDGPTGPVVWGEPGTNGQHAFHQLLHQGTELVPCDFIGVARSDVEAVDRQDLLLANLLAQSAALAFGRTPSEVADAGVAPDEVPHRTFPGDRPSTVILARELSPRALGNLVALYEHKVLVQSAVWAINPFDQWGVELGKQLAGAIVASLRGDDAAETPADPATAALVERYRHWRSER